MIPSWCQRSSQQGGAEGERVVEEGERLEGQVWLPFQGAPRTPWGPCAAFQDTLKEATSLQHNVMSHLAW